jgi:hypothetical protein
MEDGKVFYMKLRRFTLHFTGGKGFVTFSSGRLSVKIENVKKDMGSL